MITTSKDKLIRKLSKRKWKKSHIARTIKIIEKANKVKSEKILFWDRMLLFMLFFILVLISILVPISLLPIIAEMSNRIVIFITSLLGLCFGFLIDSVVREIDSLSEKHYLIAGLLIPSIATITSVFIINSVKIISAYLGIIIKINPLVFVFFYVLSLSLPHIFYKIKENTILKHEIS